MKNILSKMIGATTLLSFVATASAGFVEVTGNISTDTRWTRDNVYILREVVYVLPPAKLTIEPGTIIRGVKEGSGFDTAATQSPGALIVARGAKIIANATPDDPIVLTSVDDPNVIGGAATIPATVNGNAVTPRNYAPDGATNTNGFAYDAEWGGLVLLGDAPIGFDADGDGTKLQYDSATNTYSGDTLHYPTGAASPLAGSGDIKGGDGVGVALIEGANISTASGVTYTEPFPGADNEPATGTIIPGVYGGLTRADNNGVLRFVESRYGGFVIGASNELNGITFGATGSATVCEWLSSYNNADDGFEFFGGFTNFRYLFSLYQGDDGFDGDQGYSGNMQFLFNITDNQSMARSGFASNNTTTGRVAANIGDNTAEWDGSEEATPGSITPNSVPYMYNFTLMTSPAAGKDFIRSRRGTVGNWRNGLFQDGPDDAWRPFESSAAPVQNFQVYSGVSDNATQLGATIYTDDAATALASEMVGKGHLTFNGLDVRLASGAASAVVTNFNKPVNRTGDYAFSGWAPAPFAGVARDNNVLKWTVLEYLDVLGTTNIARPAVSIGINGSNPTVSFASAAGVGGRASLYMVERSSDLRSWNTVGIVSDNDGAGTLDNSGATFATADANGTANAVRITDTATTFTAGTPVYYRVNAL